MRARRWGWQAVLVLCGAAALVLTGCAAEEAPAVDVGSAEQSEASTETVDTETNTDDSLDAAAIVATIEPHGFECTIKDARLKVRDEVIACKGDDYVIITATSLDDPNAMDKELASAKKTICKNQKTLGIDTMRTAVSGKWVFTPGGDDDKNLAAFDAAMKSFGLEWNEDPC